MSPCISLNRAKHSGGFLPRTGGGRRLGVSCPCPVLGSLVTSPPKRHRWAFVGRLPHPRSSSLGPAPPPPPAYLALVPVRAPHAPRRWHVPASAPLFRGGLRAARPTHPVPPNSCQGVPCAGLQMRGRAGPGPRSQGSGEQGAGQGRALPLARARRQRGFGVSRTAGFPQHAPPPDLRPAGGRGVGRSSPTPPPALCPPGWAATGSSRCKEQVKGSHASRHGPPGLAGLSSSKEANLFFIQNPYKTIEQ